MWVGKKGPALVLLERRKGTPSRTCAAALGRTKQKKKEKIPCTKQEEGEKGRQLRGRTTPGKRLGAKGRKKRAEIIRCIFPDDRGKKKRGRTPSTSRIPDARPGWKTKKGEKKTLCVHTFGKRGERTDAMLAYEDTEATVPKKKRKGSLGRRKSPGRHPDKASQKNQPKKGRKRRAVLRPPRRRKERGGHAGASVGNTAQPKSGKKKEGGGEQLCRCLPRREKRMAVGLRVRKGVKRIKSGAQGKRERRAVLSFSTLGKKRKGKHLLRRHAKEKETELEKKE